MINFRRAADVLLGGGIIAYPTEGIFGLGCLPDDQAAIERLLAVKKRDPAKGLILIAARPAQFAGWIDACQLDQMPDPDPARAVTWIVRPSDHVLAVITGRHAGLAVRITINAVAASICDAVDMPLVSTSANVSGRPVARNRYLLQRNFGHLVDYIVPGHCGPGSGASEIRDLETGTVLRPGRT